VIIIRLWHKDLIPYLPKNQLLGQWRECCCIAKNIANNGTPNHILVNKIMDYPIEHFIAYTTLVKQEMQKRGYKYDASRFTKWLEWDAFKILKNEIFEDWHNNLYLKICIYNLYEKYLCGGISNEEWSIIVNKFKEYF
jgi:uncharacterized protein (TIGR02328 family)